jgi:hypothetical protein
VDEKMTMDEKVGGEPKIGRREFVKGSGVAVAVATMGPVTLLSGRVANAADEGFSEAYFSAQTGAFFQVDAGAGGWNALELMEVTGRGPSPQLDQFTVRFRGAANVAFDEGLYSVSPPEGDAFALHMQPTGSDDDGVYYDASFALVKPTQVPEPNIALGLLGGAAMLTLLQTRRSKGSAENDTKNHTKSNT